jgi:hypothetical protein
MLSISQCLPVSRLNDWASPQKGLKRLRESLIKVTPQSLESPQRLDAESLSLWRS